MKRRSLRMSLAPNPTALTGLTTNLANAVKGHPNHFVYVGSSTGWSWMSRANLS